MFFKAWIVGIINTQCCKMALDILDSAIDESLYHIHNKKCIACVMKKYCNTQHFTLYDVKLMCYHMWYRKLHVKIFKAFKDGFEKK